MSPIRASQKHRYPRDWKAIAAAIKVDRAGLRCECSGECGRGHQSRCPNRHANPAIDTGSLVVLTVAHLNHTPEDCRPENLRAMCQGCHLHYDRDHHAETRRATVAAARRAAGQQTLWDET
ncbi:MAG: hypothetical protein LBK42_10465 [Propionibacteriaceae bacterium]|jgi:hypothetical protein|nr:hypothetical protein [Propionibacteriaceae bacterium]